jgi:hypothetical protein
MILDCSRCRDLPSAAEFAQQARRFDLRLRELGTGKSMGEIKDTLLHTRQTSVGGGDYATHLDTLVRKPADRIVNGGLVLKRI